MKAIGFKTSLPIIEKNSLVEFYMPVPVPQGHDILVKVRAVSVNPVDYKIRSGSAKDKELEVPRILGYDASGVVEAIGENVTCFEPGDEVYYAGDINRVGSNAEYQLVDERIVGFKPERLNFIEAASVPLTMLTAWELIFDRMMLSKSPQNTDEKAVALVISGAGGVGSMAIQLLKNRTNIKILATASRKESADWCKKLGADLVVDHTNLIDNLKANGIDHVDYIFNFVSTDMYWEQMCQLIKPQGRVGCIVGTSKELKLGLLFNKSVSFSWELMFTRPTFKTPDMNKQQLILNEVSGLLDNDAIKPTVTKILKGFSVQNFKEAHQILESGKSIGKIVIEY